MQPLYFWGKNREGAEDEPAALARIPVEHRTLKEGKMDRITRRANRSTLPTLFATLSMVAIALAVIARPAGTARAEGSDGITIPEAVAQAAESGHPVLATAETTESSSVVANPDGTLTATLGAGPLQEPDPDSPTGWSPIDLTLEHAGGAYAPAVSAADTTFSDGGSGDLATLQEGSTSYAEGWNAALPAPSVSGDTATYPNVRPNVDLMLTAQTSGFEQRFVVKAPPSQPPVLDVPLSLEGLSATVDDTGSLIVTDVHGETVATAGTAVMFGAALDAAGEPLVSAVVDTEVVSTQDGPVFRISPDMAFFSEPGLTYPVTIDPSPNLDVTYDTYVRQSTPTTSHMTDDVLKVGTNDGSDKYRALLEFTGVADLVTNPIEVSSATLNLFQIDAKSCTATEVDVYDATSNWITVTPVTWNSKPSAGTLYASASAAHGKPNSSCSSSGMVNISTGGADGHTLADLVQAWADGTIANDGVIVQAASESNSDYWKKFRSADAGSNTPTLSVTYTESPLVCPPPSSDVILGDVRDTVCATQRTADSYISGGVAWTTGSETVDGITATYKEIPLVAGDETGDSESDHDTLVTSDGTGEYPAGSLFPNFPGEAGYDSSMPTGFLVEPDSDTAPDAVSGLTAISGSKRCGQVSSNSDNSNSGTAAFYATCSNRYKPNNPPGGSTIYRVVWFQSGSAHGGDWLHHLMTASARDHVLASYGLDVWSPDDSQPYSDPTTITATLSADIPGGSASISQTFRVYPDKFGVQYLSIPGSRYYYGWDGDKGCGGGSCQYIGIHGGFQFSYIGTYPDYNQWVHISWSAWDE